MTEEKKVTVDTEKEQVENLNDQKLEEAAGGVATPSIRPGGRR